MSRTFEFCKLGEAIDGIQTVAFWRQDARPNDALPEGALLKERTITRPQEQTGTITDPETEEEIPVMTEVPDKYCKWEAGALLAMTEEERTARDAYDVAQRIATITPALWQIASIFRTILRRHFGENAEINHDVTEAAVETYFVNRNLTGTSGDTDAADAMILTSGFGTISGWTGDGTTWAFPWDNLDE